MLLDEDKKDINKINNWLCETLVSDKDDNEIMKEMYNKRRVYNE